MVSLIALDLDGTLFRGDRTVSERSLAVLQECRARGLRIAIATARPYASVGARLDARLHRGIPWICSNGAVIYRDGRCLYQDAMPPETAREALLRLEAVPEHLTLSMEIAGRLYVNEHLDIGPVPFEVALLSATVSGPVNRILITTGMDMAPLPALPDLPAGCALTPSDGGRAVHVLSPTASKERALAALLEMEGLSFAEVMAFGDDVTDIEVLRRSGVGVAMGSAVPEVRRAADRVAPTNEEDGVAVVLEEWLAAQPGRQDA